ncbi:MAG TPA: winged helix-turn-helix transcriptional regulator [Candidatus Binatia bacterium]|nr:winged helix-turn-helix transcriptional regulator [Candidatus Binatia bacterium]
MGASLKSPLSREAAARRWTLLSNHGHVLVCLARHPRMRVRDVAVTVGITERACYRIIGDLVAAGLLRRERIGRNNRYQVETTSAAAHPAWEGMRVSSLLDIG